MSAHDDDILDFDFFEEDATREAQGAQQGAERRPISMPGGGGRGARPGVRAPQGITPLLRLVGLIAFAIVVVVLLVVWVQGCSTDKKRETYNGYMTQIGDVGADSAKIGADVGELLTTPGLKQSELETKLGGLVQRQELDVKRAQELDAPGPLQPAHEHAIEALHLRVGGLNGLLATFKATKGAKDATAAGQQLSAQGRRLEASDVIWQDLFRQPAQSALVSEDVAGVTTPQSVFVDNVELYAARSMTSIWQRVHGASTGGTPSGVHGTGLGFLKVQPSGATLSPSTEATIKASTDLGFEVGVTNTGENQEVQVEVTLTIPKQPNPIVKKATIDLIDVGETKSVTFKDFPDPPFGEKTTVQISVKPVPGEKNTSNNSVEYPVIFSLG